MVWCQTCSEDVELIADESAGFSCCPNCGRVLEDIAFASDVQFAKGADGEGELVGQFVGEGGEARGMGRFSGGRLWGGQGGDSHESAVSRGRMEIANLVEHFHITPASEALEAAHRLYRLAMQRGFTRGRRVNQVAATCLYIYCRQEKRPFMLIDFSDHLSINVYALGSVYLQLLRLFRLEDYPAFTRPVDPSLYLHRFVDRLKFGAKASAVSATAMKLVQSMKRDWMQTGRRPAGICGAALFIASHIHGFERSKREIVSVVHVGWSTVEKRVVEFAQSEAGSLTVEGLNKHAELLDYEKGQLLLEAEQAPLRLTSPSPPPMLPAPPSSGSQQQQGEGQEGGEAAAEGAGGEADEDPEESARTRALMELQRTGGCEHVAAGAAAPLAHGLCRACYEEYVKVSGGVVQAAVDPPAYQAGLIKALHREVLELARAVLPPHAGVAQGKSARLLAFADAEMAAANPLARDASQLAPDVDAEGANEEAARIGGVGPTSGEGSRAGAASPAAPGVGSSDDNDLDPDLEEMEDALRRSELGSLTKLMGIKPKAAPASLQGPGAQAAGSSQAATQPVQELRPPAQQPGSEAAPGPAATQAGTTQPYNQQQSVQEDGEPPRKRVRFQDTGMEGGQQPEGQQQGEGEGQEEQDRTTQGGQALQGSSTQGTGEGSSQGDGSGERPEGASGGEGAGPDDMSLAIVPAAAIVPVPAPEEVEPSDTLSDMDSDEAGLYVASTEEAELKGLLWSTMNREWIEKQEAKKAAAEAAAAAGIEPKEKRTRKGAGQGKKSKAATALPPAETPEEAAKNMLEARRSKSTRINYNALADLFNDEAGAAPGEEQPDTAPAAALADEEQVEAEDEGGPSRSSRASGRKEAGGSRSSLLNPAALAEVDVESQSVKVALKRHAAQRAAEQAQERERYKKALEAERGKRSGGGGMLGGSFLSALTFAPGAEGGQGGGAGGGRQRPQGLGGPKLRGKT